MRLLAILGACIAISACGGGSGSSPTASSSTLTGVAATGAALANASVTITDSAGNSPCVETSISTTSLGSYTCTLKSGETAPFFVVVTDPTGNSAPLVSIATTTPAAGTPLTVNATPLTTAIVAQLSSDGNPLTLVSSGSVNTADLANVTAKVVAQLANVLASINAPAGYDPFTTSITAATANNTGNTADLVLDVVKVVTDPSTGKLALSTISDPTPIVIATTTTSGSVVAQPDSGLSDLSKATQLAASVFNSCFAVPSTIRATPQSPVPSAADGGPGIASLAPECQNIVAGTYNAANYTFLQNGYAAGQFFYGLLVSPTMDGAKFSVPEIMAYYPHNSSALSSDPDYYDRAVVNIKYVDKDGNPGNKITVAARIPGTSTINRPTEWWLVGNQQSADISITPNIRRVEQLKAGTGPFVTGLKSRFQTGINVTINTQGPGSVRSGLPLNFVRVSGPGLPGNGTTPGSGLVYGLNPNNTVGYMDLLNKTGTLSGTTFCGGGVLFDCPNQWFAATQGLTSTLAANPTSISWVQSGDGMDGSLIKNGGKYKFELFYGTNTGTADVTIRKTLLNDMIPVIQAINLPWNTLGSASQNALNPTSSLAGAQTSLAVDWVQNPSAQQIGSLRFLDAGGSYVGRVDIPKGATSATLSGSIPAISGSSGRALLLNYRMLDSSSKSMVSVYN